jgi:hypothetical protein
LKLALLFSCTYKWLLIFSTNAQLSWFLINIDGIHYLGKYRSLYKTEKQENEKVLCYDSLPVEIHSIIFFPLYFLLLFIFLLFIDPPCWGMVRLEGADSDYFFSIFLFLLLYYQSYYILFILLHLSLIECNHELLISIQYNICFIDKKIKISCKTLS